MLAAAICAAALLSPALITIVVLGDHVGVGGENIARGILGTLLVSTVYAAVFVAVGLLLKRALVAGVIYILVWESSDLRPTLDASTGVIALLIVIALAVVAGAWRLGRMDLP
mgnify:CR=1 FL=1